MYGRREARRRDAPAAAGHRDFCGRRKPLGQVSGAIARRCLPGLVIEVMLVDRAGIRRTALRDLHFSETCKTHWLLLGSESRPAQQQCEKGGDDPGEHVGPFYASGIQMHAVERGTVLRSSASEGRYARGAVGRNPAVRSSPAGEAGGNIGKARTGASPSDQPASSLHGTPRAGGLASTFTTLASMTKPWATTSPSFMQRRSTVSTGAKTRRFSRNVRVHSSKR